MAADCEETMLSKGISKWFRGLAILMVIASHYAGWMYVEPENPMLRAWFMTLGVYGVDIFFMLSGYGLVKATEKRGVDGRFLWNRFSSAYLPYIVLIGTLVIVDGNPLDKQGWFDFLTGYHYWFMANLFLFYILFMVFWKIKILRKVLLTTGVAVYSWHLFSLGYQDFWFVSNMAFVVGVFYAELEKWKFDLWKKWYSRVIILPASFVAMRFCYFKYMETAKLSWENATSILFTVCMMEMCLFLSMIGKRIKNHRIVRIISLDYIVGILGTYSVFIYLLHTRLFYFIIFKLDEELGYRNLAIVVGCITLVVAVLIGFVFTKLVDWITKVIDRGRGSKLA